MVIRGEVKAAFVGDEERTLGEMGFRRVERGVARGVAVRQSPPLLLARLAMHEPEAGDGDVRLVAALLEEQPLHDPGAAEPASRKKGRGLGEADAVADFENRDAADRVLARNSGVQVSPLVTSSSTRAQATPSSASRSRTL